MTYLIIPPVDPAKSQASNTSLGHSGWPIIFIDHEGSNSESIAKVIKGFEVFPSGADLFLYRLKDLDVVINALNDGKFELANDSYILMGHSIVWAVATLYANQYPNEVEKLI